jgi:FMN phosphatase YigB (HAD superfamily)
VFKLWAKDVGEKHNIPWKNFYKKYKHLNWWLSFKKIFSSGTLQEHFNIVLQRTIVSLKKKYAHIKVDEFLESASASYIEKELTSFEINKEMVDFLIEEKSKGTKIYLVSDFYCDSKTLSYWLEKLNVLNLFDDVFSSCDFDKEKATRKIYKYLIKKMYLNPKSITMYGDNLWSDILMARSCGLTAYRIKISTTKEKLCQKRTK